MSTQRASEKAFPDEEPEFQVAPMIDILLVLMTFFMSITSTEVINTSSKLVTQLPVAKDSKKKDTNQNEMILNVGWVAEKKQGAVEIDENIYEVARISDIISLRKGNKATFRVVIRASEEVPYSYMQEVMMACAAAGVDNITFSVLSQSSRKGGNP